MFLVRGLPPDHLAKFPKDAIIGNGLKVGRWETVEFLLANYEKKPDVIVEQYNPDAHHNITRKIVAQHPAACIDLKAK